ncbi:MAG: acyltransferase [Candidatus Pacearchaeota archaeon]|jgi:acetyltransferase-like isoleucine patch superfamily enzyme
MHSQEWKDKWKLSKIEHGKLTKYNFLVHYPEGLTLGKYIDISQFVYIQSRMGVIIEDDVEIGPFTAILSESTIDNKSGLIKICKGAKIGTHSTIMPNVTIGENSIIGAYSLVKKDIPPNVIAYGVPCKIIKKL